MESFCQRKALDAFFCYAYRIFEKQILPLLTGGTKRFVAIILPALLPILLQHRQISGYVVRGEREKEDISITRQGIMRLYERIDRAVLESDCGCDFHSINRRGRHTIATFMNNAALDEKTIESQLGHYDVRFTRRRYMNAQAGRTQHGTIGGLCY